jgi:hypothetical protein
MKRRLIISGSRTAADGFTAEVKVQCEAFLQHAGPWRKAEPKPGMDAAKPRNLKSQLSNLNSQLCLSQQSIFTYSSIHDTYSWYVSKGIWIFLIFIGKIVKDCGNIGQYSKSRN